MAASDTDGSAGFRRALEDLISLTCPAAAQVLSGKLVKKFSSLGAVLAAPAAERTAVLREFPQVERTLMSMQAAIAQVLHGHIAGRPILSCDQAVIDYLRSGMAFASKEQFRVLFLDAGNRLIADELLGTGTVAGVHVYPREILKRCLDLGATAIILAHNHPSGRMRPSRADEELTNRIVTAARSLDVTVHDHLIIAAEGALSFRQTGRL